MGWGWGYIYTHQQQDDDMYTHTYIQSTNPNQQTPIIRTASRRRLVLRSVLIMSPSFERALMKGSSPSSRPSSLACWWCLFVFCGVISVKQASKQASKQSVSQSASQWVLLGKAGGSCMRPSPSLSHTHPSPPYQIRRRGRHPLVVPLQALQHRRGVARQGLANLLIG